MPKTVRPYRLLLEQEYQPPSGTDNYTEYNCNMQSYRAVNTLRLGYKNQPVNVADRNNNCLVWDPHKT